MIVSRWGLWFRDVEVMFLDLVLASYKVNLAIINNLAFIDNIFVVLS